MLGTNIILIVCLYPFVLFMYVFLKMDATPKKNMYYGVTLTKEQQQTPQVQRIQKAYNRQMRIGLWILMLLPIPLIFIPWFSIFMIGYMVWLLASVLAFFIPFGWANTKLKALKVELGWKEEAEQPVYTELKDAGSVRRVKWYHFLPQALISVALLVWVIMVPQEDVTNIMVWTFSGVTFLFWGAAVWMDRQKTQIISRNSDVNVNYARAKKKLWKDLWVMCAWTNVIYLLCMFVAMNKRDGLGSFFWLATILYTIGTLVFFCRMLSKKNQVDATYRSRMDVLPQDDDDKWIFGMIYYNPKDKHSMVEKRVGMGTTTNMATPVGKALFVFLAVSLLAVPVLCIWLVLTEFTPINLEIREDQVVASHLKDDYVIPLHSIRKVELLSELPKMSRNYGTSIENLKKGHFRAGEEADSSVFLNPQNEVFLRIETSTDIYYFSGCDDAQTREVFERIK